MEKTSLKLVFFFFSLTIIAFCLYWGDAREMTKEQMNCLGDKCLEGKKYCNCLPPVAHIMAGNGVCQEDPDCIKYCPIECNPGTCACACNGGNCSCQCY